jgi:hypothetical protein
MYVPSTTRYMRPAMRAYARCERTAFSFIAFS